MSFCTSINCIDGRVQQPALDYLTQRYGVQYVDTVTETGPNGILNRQDEPALIESMLRCIDVSVSKHKSMAIAVIGHHDCAGNPGDENHQNTDTRGAVRFLRSKYPDTPVIGVYIDESWTAREIEVSDV
jgi:carbonic anhydrase